MNQQLQRSRRRGVALAENPLEGEQLLLDVMFGTRSRRHAKAVVAAPEAEKALNYRVVSISLYNEDIDRLERLTEELKRRGHHRVNKSQVIRYALAQIDLDKIPREM
jgi:hypothetical protein